MANQNDSNIIKTMIGLPEHDMPDFFRKYADKIQDDSVYWGTLGTLWKATGNTHEQEAWLPLFKAKRRNKKKIMKARERKEFSRLPKTVTAYRAVNNDDEENSAISWTLTEEVANRIFSKNGQRKVISKQFDKSQIFAYFDRRNEQEILVFHEP